MMVTSGQKRKRENQTNTFKNVKNQNDRKVKHRRKNDGQKAKKHHQNCRQSQLDSYSPHFCQELVQSLLPLQRPDLELAGGVDGVAEAIEQRPMAVQQQLQLLVKRDPQAIHGQQAVIILSSVIHT